MREECSRLPALQRLLVECYVITFQKEARCAFLNLSTRKSSCNRTRNPLARSAVGHVTAAQHQQALQTVAQTQSALGLSAIRSAGCAAAIWHRDPLTEFQAWIDTLEPAMLPTFRTTLRPERVRQAVTQVCEICDTPVCANRDRLIDDVAAMADIFADLMSAPYVALRLEAVTSDACRKFHIDALTARLICTYRGPGTQYGIAVNGAQPESIATVPTGSPLVLRGTLWPEQPPASLRHRSPPIKGSGQTRLVLVLDAVADLEGRPVKTNLH